MHFQDQNGSRLRRELKPLELLVVFPGFCHLDGHNAYAKKEKKPTGNMLILYDIEFKLWLLYVHFVNANVL